jgi:transposase InsO family protein
MYMSYSNNPHLPRVRMDAVLKVRGGWSIRKTARHFGVHPSTVLKWARRAPSHGKCNIPTLSSRPHHHPDELREEIVSAVLAYREKYHRCAEVLHAMLARDGVVTSLSSVKRTLRRYELTYPSRWKKWHTYPPRPLPEKPGILVEIDTVHVGMPDERLSLYTLLDVCSRWAHAIPVLRINTHRSLSFVSTTQTIAPFAFQTIQSDHGPEFSKWFTKQLIARGLSHRHSRIRTPNDNAHLERFNRTIQEECIQRIPRDLRLWKKELPDYLRYYNEERPHMGLDMKTPTEVLRSY